MLPCKHVIAARLVCARDHGGKAPEIVTDAVPDLVESATLVAVTVAFVLTVTLGAW